MMAMTQPAPGMSLATTFSTTITPMMTGSWGSASSQAICAICSTVTPPEISSWKSSIGMPMISWTFWLNQALTAVLISSKRCSLAPVSAAAPALLIQSPGSETMSLKMAAHSPSAATAAAPNSSAPTVTVSAMSTAASRPPSRASRPARSAPHRPSRSFPATSFSASAASLTFCTAQSRAPSMVLRHLSRIAG